MLAIPRGALRRRTGAMIGGITGDRQDPTKFHTFSYELRTDNSGIDGGEGLFQRTSVNTIGIPDSSFNYFLSKPEGAMVAIGCMARAL